MLQLNSGAAVYTMSASHAPVGRAHTGDVVQFETQDCFGGQITRAEQRLGGIDFAHINPATGPLYVEEAEPGDTLRVDILDIELADQAVAVTAPGHGVFGDLISEESTRILPLQNGQVVFSDQIRLPLCPMIGVIGTAPAQGEVETGTPGSHGGNMDCSRIGKGAVLYLPVAVPGALLAMGDLHAVMGDGEICVCGAEVAGRVTVRVSVRKGCDLPLPFLRSGAEVMAISSAPTLEEAARDATVSMQRLLSSRLSLAFDQAGILLSLCGNLRICQVVDPQVTCRMEVPVSLFEDSGVSVEAL